LNTSTYRSAEYLVQITDAGYNPPNIHVEKLVLFHDGGSQDFYMTEYAIVSNNGELGTFGAVFTGGNLVLTFTPTSPVSMTVKLLRTAITI
jgi:hypothetical protein